MTKNTIVKLILLILLSRVIFEQLAVFQLKKKSLDCDGNPKLITLVHNLINQYKHTLFFQISSNYIRLSSQSFSDVFASRFSITILHTHFLYLGLFGEMYIFITTLFHPPLFHFDSKFLTCHCLLSKYMI